LDDREEGQIQIKRQHKDDHTTPRARSVSVEVKYSPQPMLIESPEESDTLSGTDIVPNCPAIINDVVGLELGPLPRKESRWFVDDVDVSEKWHLFKEKSLELANREGLFVESHTQQILYALNCFIC